MYVWLVVCVFVFPVVRVDTVVVVFVFVRLHGCVLVCSCGCLFN